VDIKDPLYVAHGFFRGRHDQSLVCPESQEQAAESGESEK
jgi:hypothetical protein